MKFIAQLFVGVFMLSNAIGQNIKPLKIGEIVPSIEFRLFDNEKKLIQLSDFKGKLVILDFFATWCGPCLGGMFTSDSMQKKFGDKIQVLLINSKNRERADTKDKLQVFKEKVNSLIPQFSLPIIFDDTAAYSFFPHSGIPHYVWISAEGNYLAATQFIKMDYISSILAGGKIDAAIKEGFRMDELYIDGITPLNINEADYYTFFKKGEIENVQPLGKFVARKDASSKKLIVERAIFRNQTLMEIYNRMYSSIDLKKRVIFQDVDASKIKQDVYNYDLIAPQAELNEFNQLIMEDLNRLTPYTAGLEKKMVRCLVLKRTSAKDKIKSNGYAIEDSQAVADGKWNVSYNNVDLSRLLYDLNESGLDLLVLDETHYTNKVNIELDYLGDDIKRLRNELRKYDLDLIETKREMEMLVIRGKKSSNKILH